MRGSRPMGAPRCLYGWYGLLIDRICATPRNVVIWWCVIGIILIDYCLLCGVDWTWSLFSWELLLGDYFRCFHSHSHSLDLFMHGGFEFIWIDGMYNRVIYPTESLHCKLLSCIFTTWFSFQLDFSSLSYCWCWLHLHNLIIPASSRFHYQH